MPLNLTFTPTIIQALDNLIRSGGYKGPADYFAARVRRDAGLEQEGQMPLLSK